MRELTDICIPPQASMREAMERINGNQCGIALVVDADQRLVGTITDGDLRRAILAGTDLDTGVSSVVCARGAAGQAPITAPAGTANSVLLQLMTQRRVRQIPLLDTEGRVAGLVLLDDVLPSRDSGVQAVIMAGGLGKRLRPLTEELPKPMLTVGDRPLMQWIIEQLGQAGIRHLNITTHYKPEKIVEHFGDGAAFGVHINYVNEDRPLGTGGALGLLPRPNERTLLINGDILTRVDFRALLAYHVEQQATLTVGLHVHEVQIPYGVVACDGTRVLGIQEKPVLRFFVNAGIYLLEPSVYSCIPNGAAFNMTDLIGWLVEKGDPVAAFPIHEYWIDIGQHAQYARAQADAPGLRPDSAPLCG